MVSPSATLVGASCLFLALSGCRSGDDVPQVSSDRRAVVADAAHGGRTGFYFLPPLVPPTPLPVPFDDTRSLVALLRAPDGAVLATAPLVVDTVNQNYHGKIDTAGLGLDGSSTYRLAVEMAGLELGHADVFVFGAAGDARRFASEEDLELVDGRKLPVKVYLSGLDDGPAPPGPSCGEGEAPFMGVCLPSVAACEELLDPSRSPPRFVTTHHLSPGDVAGISRFRSSAGHDYSDSFETCRSMKHYFAPAVEDWSALQVRSPVAGTIVELYEEWAGTKVLIRSRLQPALFFHVFHVVLTPPAVVGDAVQAGQVLGHHVGNQTQSDVAVSSIAVANGAGGPVLCERLVSLFDVMADEAFAAYQARGIPSRAAFIIDAAERDAFPLTCDGEWFVEPWRDPLQRWVALGASP